MFESLTGGIPRAAFNAARLLYDQRRTPRIKLDTLRVDITAEPGNRGKAARAAAGGTPAGA